MKALLRIAPIVLLAWTVGAWAQSLQIIELQHSTAADVIPVLQPLLESGGALSGQDDRLFVRASAANVAQLRQALAAIDRPLQQWIIAVRRSTQAEIQRSTTAAAGTLSTRNGAIAVNERARAQSGVTVHGTRATAHRDDESVSTVRVSEGGAAFIATGSSVPRVTAIAGVTRRGPWAAAAVEYRDLSSGFLATPRVNGEEVTLQIEQHHAGRAPEGGIETQRLTTVVRGRLGEWIALGGVDESSHEAQREVLAHRHATRSEQRLLWVKVERATDGL